MKRNIDIFTRLYGWSLHLYPAAFRKAFAAEMSEVFQSALEDSYSTGSSSLVVCLREVWEYPFNLFRQHWVQFTRQEMIMVTNQGENITKICPRCQRSNQSEANYCFNCGRAFIPFREHITEKSRSFFNANYLLRVFGGLIFVILSLIAADRILFHGFHPATNMIVLSGVAVMSFLAGWRLFGNAPNFKKLRFLVIIAVVSLGFFKLTSEIDELYLRNTLTSENPLSYQFLDSETYVAYVEEKQAFYTDQHLNQNNWMQMYLYFPPLDKIGIDGTALYYPLPPTNPLFEDILKADTHPALAIERSWEFKDYYGLFLMLFIASGLYAGFYTTKKNAMRSLAL